MLGLSLEVEAAAQLKSLSPESLQFRTFEVLTELLARVANDQPVVILLDDLHWADATSLALTEQLLELAESRPLMLAISQRPETEHPSWSLKEKAAREYRHIFQEVSLPPLSRESESELLSSLAGNRSLPDPIRDQILGYAEGNPFYLEQLVRSLIDDGTLVAKNSHWEVKSGEVLTVPQTLEGVIIARIDRLQPDWREVVTSTSVLGRTFGLDLIGAVTKLEVADVKQAVHHLMRLDLLHEDAGGERPVYRFKHALIQETAYKTLVRPKRAELHRRAAEWYETFYRGRLERVYGLIAHHWLGTDDHDTAARYLKLAGDRALSEWALDEAIGHFRELVPLLERIERQQDAAEVLFQLATTLHLAMRYHEANEVWQQAFAKWSPPMRITRLEGAALRISSPFVPWDPKPARSDWAINGTVHQQLYATLLEARPGPYVLPSLAVRWNVTDDGRKYDFELDPNATWNDGSAIRAADVVESFRAILDPATQATEVGTLAVLEGATAYNAGEITDFARVGICARDERTLEFRLWSPTPYWPFVLVWPAKTGTGALLTSGPFGLARMDSDRVVIVRDSRYRRGSLGNVGEVEWVLRDKRFDPVEALVKGEIDIATHLELLPDVVSSITSRQLVITMGAPVTTAYFRFSGQPHETDVQLRRALAYATDRRLMIPRLSASRMIATGGLVPPGVPGHTPETALPFRPELARESLRRSRHEGPLYLTLYGPRTGRYPAWEPLVESWRQVLGMTIELRFMDRKRDWYPADFGHVHLEEWAADHPDPADFLYALLHSRSSTNFSRWSSPKLDDLIDRAVLMKSSSARLALFHEADRLAVQREGAVIPLYYERFAVIHQPWVHGIRLWSVFGVWEKLDELTVDRRSPRANGMDDFPYPAERNP